MRLPELLRRELRVVFGARVTWFILAASALLIGHSFVLAIDLFSAASRSALGFGLMQREMDPLMGVLRPMLGGLHLAASLLVPVMAARGLAIERERRSYGALALACGGTTPIVLAKGVAALCASVLMLAPVLVLSAVFLTLGGHLGARETTVAVLGHALHLVAFTGVALAAAAGTRTVAQATTIAVSLSLASWAIDAGEGFAALAWLGRWEWAQISRQLEPFEQGVVALGAVGWLAILAAAAIAVALFLARFAPAQRRWGPAGAAAALCVAGLRFASTPHRAYDWSEQQRASLPPAAVDALRSLPGSIRVEIFLDRDDGRRALIERDALAKLLLARPDLVIDTPLDQRERPSEGERDDGYGRVVVHAGGGARETRSTSRREITTLVFEAASVPLPDWSQPAYPGYPTVIEGSRRTWVVAIAYMVQPLVLLVVGWLASRIKRRPS